MGKNIGILGATGVVGRQMMQCLAERDFDVDNLRLFASERSAGKKLNFYGSDIVIENAATADFSGIDIMLGAADNKTATDLSPKIVNSGAVFVDNSSAFRMNSDVPLVVPEINAEDAKNNSGIISNPNCSTIIALVAISGIAANVKINSIVASTYQAASGAGQAGLSELEGQLNAFGAAQIPNAKAFDYQLACNLIPSIGSDTGNGFTTEEMKMQNEGRKILHLPELNVSCTCVRVPVMRSHSISLSLFLDEQISAQQARTFVLNSKGCKLVDDLNANKYPMPLSTTNQDEVYVGRIRNGLADKNEICL